MADISIAVVNQGQCLAKTSSRCVTGSVTATHDFEVTNFSLLNGMGTGKFVRSSTFSAGGREWNIRLYPDGYDTEHKDYVSVSLHFLNGALDVRVKFSLHFLFDKGDQVLKRDTHTFKSIDDNWGWGWSDFFKKSKLQELLPSNDHRFTIRCILTVIDDPHTQLASTIAVPRSKLHQDLADTLKGGEGKDVTFSAGGQLFTAHRSMLAARSMVFKAELFGQMKEKDTSCITIDDMDPAIFEALLYFIYTDSLPDDCNADNKNVMMQHLLVAADRYGLDRLRLMCEEKLCESMDVQTVATILALAEQHHCTQLKDVCLEFIASHGVLGVVMETDEFKHLSTSCPSIMKDILDKVAANAIRRE
ncbi:hypothetical protein PR202_gb14322 [Eleusine coracana subsp. coracana]|uniref:Uncharacterized protein n=1 Tax=Eleusine coracana subsp. coracana TaxID=191504 RepID=A0AAV5EW03_ELECO|nr:hypothetical protein PR202_gb14322 [Eleusine coracana subsp. coracana]